MQYPQDFFYMFTHMVYTTSPHSRNLRPIQTSDWNFNTFIFLRKKKGFFGHLLEGHLGNSR